MSTMKFSRGMFTLMAIVFALVMAACSPTASPTAGPGAGATTVPGSTSAGEPTDAVKAFYTALFSGGDAASFVCTTAGVDSAQVQDGYKQITAAFANSKIDTSGLTFTASDVTADKANVAVNGSMSVETSGVKTDLPLTIGAIPVVKEGDSWKICG